MVNNQPLLVIDLDGTLLDSSRRLYKLFCQLAPGSELTLEEFWTAKRLPTSNEDLLRQHASFQPDEIDRFKKEWLTLIETPEFLILDELHDRVTEGLGLLATKFRLLLLTARQSLPNAREQLQRMHILKYFSDVLVTGGVRSKFEVFQQSSEFIPEDSLLIGDTAEDIRLGRMLGVKTTVVQNGFRCEQYLRQHAPDELHSDFFSFAQHASSTR